MSLKKANIIKYIPGIIVLLIISSVIYNFATHKYVIMGEKNKIYKTDIEELDLRDNKFRKGDEKVLKYFHSMRELNLRMIELESIDFINYMPDLEHIEFRVNDYTVMLVSPQGNELFEPDKKMDMTPLLFPDNLKKLGIQDATGADLSFLKELSTLEELELSWTVLNNDWIEYLSELKNLNILNLTKSHFVSLSFLQHMKNIKNLNLNDCKVEDVDISYILELKKLEHLEIICFYIEDIERLSELPYLKTVRIEFDSPYTQEQLNQLIESGIEITYPTVL